jgi:hypothetical protein
MSGQYFSLLLLLLASAFAREFCVISGDNGDFNVFDRGEAVPVPNVCGFSTCPCDPLLEDQLLCTFCYDSRRDECLVNGETKEFEDAICSCEANSVDFVCDEIIDNTDGDDRPTQKPPPQTPCVFQDENGNDYVLDTSDVLGPCFGKDFPYVCNVERNLLVYPYCEHKTKAGGTVCAKDEEYVVFVDENGQNTRCDCSLDLENLQSLSSCSPLRTLSPTRSPSSPPETQSDATTMSSFRQSTLIISFVVVALF